MKKLILSAGIAMALAFGGAASAGDEVTGGASDYEAVKELIWSKEQSIYAGRGQGDFMPYLQSTATGYSAWPPHVAKPNSVRDIEAAVDAMKAFNQEKLALEFVGFVLNGETAIIYYQTHMTVSADGRAVDERYETTHTWTQEDGEWKVLGGMARKTPER